MGTSANTTMGKGKISSPGHHGQTSLTFEVEMVMCIERKSCMHTGIRSELLVEKGFLDVIRQRVWMCSGCVLKRLVGCVLDQPCAQRKPRQAGTVTLRE
mmetsp:Transcript_116001/g.211037  ORF Transcript_116001/g.211037 Transcript_116001/m.211037 type:complete len:99 (+) Transcript_116001:758-1054(+)